ncbi:MAG: hypothetical protein M1826_006832 [Phylliscum demangeonii]|nr:MAG: hypothetical protein M1826_006832 [Phylliscum demangeonii]
MSPIFHPRAAHGRHGLRWRPWRRHDVRDDPFQDCRDNPEDDVNSGGGGGDGGADGGDDATRVRGGRIGVVLLCRTGKSDCCSEEITDSAGILLINFLAHGQAHDQARRQAYDQAPGQAHGHTL